MLLKYSLLFLSCSLLNAKTLPLSSLDLGAVEQSWGKAQKDQSVTGEPLKIAGQPFANGVGTHANSRFVIAPGDSERFTAFVGINDQKAGCGTAEFIITGDGKELWRSGIMKTGQPAQKVDLPIKNIRKLVLQVTDAGDGVNCDHADWAEAAFEYTNAAPAPYQSVAAAGPAVILTPKSPATPQIHGARVFGVRPGHPFLFTIAATGERPMKFAAEHLPAGLVLDPETGRITGTLNAKGESVVKLRAENALGKTERDLRIVCGDKIALTPPMGWNSWNCFGHDINDEKMRAAADAIVSSGLIQHGWTYVNLDDDWAGERDASGMMQPNKKFPDMKALGEYIHGKGLKFGIYSSPGPRTCSRFPGSYQHEDQDARRYGEWGVDYVKYDWCEYGIVAQNLTVERLSAYLPADKAKLQELHRERQALELALNLVPPAKRPREQTDRLQAVNKELASIFQKVPAQDRQAVDLDILQAPYRLFRTSLDKVPRDITYSLCQYGSGKVSEWGTRIGGNCWRTTGDIEDTWVSMKTIGKKQAGLEKYAVPGGWNDPDMLVVGNVWLGPTRKLHPTRLTPNEQYTHISWWCLLSAPLLIGCDLTNLDEFTYGLLSNDEVLEVDQDPLGRQAGRVSQNGDGEVWSKEMEDGSRAVGLFNFGDDEAKITVRWQDIGATGKQVVRDLWRQKDLGCFNESFEASVAPHGVVLVKIRPESK